MLTTVGGTLSNVLMCHILVVEPVEPEVLLVEPEEPVETAV